MGEKLRAQKDARPFRLPSSGRLAKGIPEKPLSFRFRGIYADQFYRADRSALQ